MAAFPAASQSIKITYGNQYVTDDGEYSYDINFPMSIMNNRRVFHNVSRFDVSKVTQKFDDCKLYVSGRLILSGVGTIISVTESEIKLQIVGGKSRIKYNDRMTKHYIDEIPFGTADKPGYDVDKGWSQKFKDRISEIYRLDEDKSKFLGVLGKWCFMPIRDETNDVINASELTTADSVEIEPLDEYTTDYDEDGSFSTSSTANLEYNLGDSANRGNYEVISKKVFDSFETVHSKELMGSDRQFASTTLSWSERKKRQTIIENFGDYYIYVEDENENKSWESAGIWSPLIRDSSSEDYVDLNISPAAQVVENINFKSGLLEDNYYEKRCLLSIPNDKEPESKECDIDEDGYSYTSVQDALDDESTLDNSEDEQECMNIFFILPGRVQTGDGTTANLSWVGEKSRWPQFMTDYRINGGYRFSGIAFIDDAFYSLSLCTKSETGTTCLGTLHDNGLKIDNKNSLQVKFKSDVIPDPSRTYIIHNRKFVCEKIEMDVKDDQIDKIYVGYFYMMS